MSSPVQTPAKDTLILNIVQDHEKENIAVIRQQALPWNAPSTPTQSNRPSPRPNSKVSSPIIPWNGHTTLSHPNHQSPNRSPRPTSAIISPSSGLRSPGSFYGVTKHEMESRDNSNKKGVKSNKSPSLSLATPKSIIADVASSPHFSGGSHVTLESVTAERDILHKTLAKVREALDEATVRLDATNSQLMIARKEADNAQKDSIASRKIAIKTEEECHTLRKQLEKAQAEIAELRGSTSALSTSLTKLSEGRAQAIAERDAVHNTLKNLRTIERRLVIVLAVRCQAFRVEIEELRKTITDLKRDITVVTGDRDALRKKVHMTVDQKKFSELEKSVTESHEREEALRATITSLSSQLESAQTACAEAEVRQRTAENKIKDLSRTQRQLLIVLAFRVAALQHRINQGKQDTLDTALDADSAKHTLRAKLSAEHRAVENLTAQLARVQAERDEAKANLIKISLEMGQSTPKK